MNIFNYDNLTEISLLENSTIGNVPSNIEDEFKMCIHYQKMLGLPTYFGKNWDALFDCLISLEFITTKNLCIVHQDLPFQHHSEDRRIYVRILFESIRHWQEYPEHKIYVYFPLHCKDATTAIINNHLLQLSDNVYD